MQIIFLGAAGEVTGSAYLVQTEQARVLVDFGLFQGRAMAREDNLVPQKLDVRKLDAVVLTHGHLDHVGRLPLLIKDGYRGPIFSTPGTIDITQLILEDSAKLSEQDAERTNRKRAARGEPPILPLFDSSDVETVVRLLKPLSYQAQTPVAPGISVRMFEAGHILGSASIEMTVTASGQKRTLVFSGDIGPLGAPILRDPAGPPKADAVIMESTYGDRDHRSLEATVEEFRSIIKEAVAQKGKILVPTFAVGRAQNILYHLASMFEERVVDPFPVVLDSPMAISATKLHQKHPELYDDEMRQAAHSSKERFLKNLPMLRYSITADDSRALNHLAGPCLIMAGAGMCNAGRILHHLRHNLANSGTTVMIVGYQAPGSIGRQLLEGAEVVTIFGEDYHVRASTHGLGGFSAHADRGGLMHWFDQLAGSRPKLFLTHGEERGRDAMRDLVQQKHGIRAVLPMLGEPHSL